MKAFSWPADIESFIRSIIIEKPILNVCAGESEFGDIRIDKFHSPYFYPIDAKADMIALPFKNDAFGAVFCDPPWNDAYVKMTAQFCGEAIRAAPVLYLMSPWIWGTTRANLTHVWYRVTPGFNRAILICRYQRNHVTEGGLK